MTNKEQKVAAKLILQSTVNDAYSSLSLPEILLKLHQKEIEVPERTLRRWLAAWVEQGEFVRTGKKRGTRYQLSQNQTQVSINRLPFLSKVTPAKRQVVMSQLRDLWTHSSTALEGNTLSLGDTHAVLELGLTISGKPLREHQELVGHARAIDLLYKMLAEPLDKNQLFELHKAVQTDVVQDIYQPIGKWKVEANYASSMTSDGQAVMIEYAAPGVVDDLMQNLITIINAWDTDSINPSSAAFTYAKIHMACVHIHPFYDGNGRIARLLANLLLLKAGMPPLIIDKSKRREYIQCLADYQTGAGPLSKTTGLFPQPELLDPFVGFCSECYQSTADLMAKI